MSNPGNPFNIRTIQLPITPNVLDAAVADLTLASNHWEKLGDDSKVKYCKDKIQRLSALCTRESKKITKPELTT